MQTDLWKLYINSLIFEFRRQPGTILVPRGRAPFGQHQESRPLAHLWPGARFSKDPVTTGPDNLPGRLTGNFTGPGIAFLEAPVNFPDTYRAR